MRHEELVKRLRTSWDADRSIISQTDIWMKERREAADCIEELTATDEELEAKLAKAVEALEKLNRRGDTLETFDIVVHEIVNATLAELKGQTDV